MGRFIASCVLYSMVFASLAAGEEALLKNGALTCSETGKVADWRMHPPKTLCKQETADLPDNTPQALRITVGETQNINGYLSQAIGMNSVGTHKLIVSGFMKSTQARGGYLSVKLYKNKKEIKRIKSKYSTQTWERYSIAFDAGDADKIEVLCRWRQEERYTGSVVCFADITLKKADKIVALVGDSTVQTYDRGNSRRGWGQLLPEFLKETVMVNNYARGGKSSKTFRTGKHWDAILADKPDIVLIQFGHNDSHAKEKHESTDAKGEYKDFLRQYITDARAAGIEPILVTPPHRRVFRTSGELSTTLEPYAESMKAVAQETAVPCIDLYALSGAVMQKLGSKECARFFCSFKDRSHYSEEGARMLAQMIARELKKDKKYSGLLKLAKN